jgi:hypothetical protein
VRAHTLPAEFSDLESFVSWALATEHARTSKRLASSMEEIQAFYDRMSARVEAVTAYLNALPLDALPPEAERLFQMSLSLMEVANAVEMFQNPAVINGFDIKRFVPVEDV